MRALDKLSLTSLFIWLVATLDAAGGLLGFWSVDGPERDYVLAVEGLLLLALLGNAIGVKRWVYRQSERPLHRQVALLSVASLVLCMGGDLVNFNLPETYYRHGQVVKHDYLADSVWFFAPGYLLLLIATLKVAFANGLSGYVAITLLSVAGLFGGIAINAMHLPGTGDYVSVITGFYGVFITVVGASGLALLVSFGQARWTPSVVLLSVGVLLAALADSVIGQFWIYGNQGEGFYPAARYINWSLYIGSQCLVIHLARVAVWHGRSR